jgi:hypothetical protein
LEKDKSERQDGVSSFSVGQWLEMSKFHFGGLEQNALKAGRWQSVSYDIPAQVENALLTLILVPSALERRITSCRWAFLKWQACLCVELSRNLTKV